MTHSLSGSRPESSFPGRWQLIARALVVATIDPRAVDQDLLRPGEPSPATIRTGTVRGSGPSTISSAPARPSTPGRSRSGARLRRRCSLRKTDGLAVLLAPLARLPLLPTVALGLRRPGAPRLDGEKPRKIGDCGGGELEDPRQWARRPAASAPLPPEVLSRPEPSDAPRGTGAEFGHCQRRYSTVCRANSRSKSSSA